MPKDKTPDEDPKMYEKYTPSEHIDKDDPPCIIFHGTSDLLVPYTNGEKIHSLANGIDPRNVEPEGQRKSIGAEYTLEKDIIEKEAVLPHIRKAAEKITRQLRKESLLAKGVRIKIKTSDFKLYTRQKMLSSSSDITNDFIKNAYKLLDKLDLEKPIRLIGLSAFGLIDNKLVLELKSVDELNDVHMAQILTYLKLGGFKLGLLINFNVALLKNGIKRVIN